jgi:1,4-dihydroxy-2-naphthoate octaprenyltransferase
LADPTLLVPASALRRALEGLDDAGLRRLARDYVAVWSRTFRTLVAHLRGRPERAVALFAEEVYPFLRGDRRAARVERAGRHEARLLLADDLPAAYLAGLLEGFVALSGAHARARPDGPGSFVVAYRIDAADRAARLAQQLATLRLPLLACALFAALAGLGAAGPDAHLAATSVAAVLAGSVGAQAGANALHSLRRGAGHPLRPGPPPALLRGTVAAGYLVAAASAAWLVRASGPGILAFATVGLALGLAYGRVRDSGLGPAVAGATYGLLIPAGAAYAAGARLLPALAAGLPLGLMAAALLLADNLADRPLDEAGGQRTLAVRLPQWRGTLAYALLLAMALVALAAAAWTHLTPQLAWIPSAVLAVPAALLVIQVRRNAGDPHALAPARLGTLGLLVAVAAIAVLATQMTWGSTL